MAAILRTLMFVALVVPATAVTCYASWRVTMWQYNNAPLLLVGGAVMLAFSIVGAALDWD